MKVQKRCRKTYHADACMRREMVMQSGKNPAVLVVCVCMCVCFSVCEAVLLLFIVTSEKKGKRKKITSLHMMYPPSFFWPTEAGVFTPWLTTQVYFEKTSLCIKCNPGFSLCQCVSVQQVYHVMNIASVRSWCTVNRTCVHSLLDV